MNQKLYIYSISKDHRTTYFKSSPIKVMVNLNWKIMNVDFF